MRRHLPRLLLLGALLSPTTLYALGLGEIRPHSALNQPFDAEIELISPTTDELAGLKVGLAGPDMYQRYGVDRPMFLSAFEFSIQRSRDGRATIKITSNRSVTEPFVTLLVEASWARGRLLREYTVLLDPPVFMPSQPEAQAPVTTPQAGAPSGGRIERPVAQQPQPAEPPAQATPLPTPSPEPTQEPVASAAGTSLSGDYTVERNDTLWRIASRVTPDGSRREVNRTMIALFRANPAAFQGNINRLRSGSVLRIPELSDIEAISTSDATAEVRRQTAEWSGAQPSQTAQEEANRLRLVTPAETPAEPTPATPAPQEQVAKAPTTPPTTAGATPGDNRVALPSQGLAETQQSATEAPVEPTQQPEATPEQQAAETSAEQTPPAEQAAPTKPVSRPPVKTAPQEPTPSLFDRIGEYWWAFIAAGALVIVAFLFVFIRRRREESSVASDAMAGLDFEPRATRAAPAMSPVTRARDRDSFLVEDSEEDTLGEMEEPAPAPTARRAEPPKPRLEPVAAAAAPAAAATSRADETMSSETQVRFDQQDALAEADFHMAYGLYDQAADLVKIAIDREPGRRDLKLKLLEIYFVWGNKDLFLDTARELHGSRAQAAPGEWDKVLIMGKQIAPEDSMFKGEAAAAHVDLVDVNLEGGENRVDVDLFAEPDADKPAGLDLEFTSGERSAPAQGGSASDLDFLLDEPKRGSDEEPTREMDPLSRTQETPTIETPAIDRSAQTMRERAIREKVAASKAEQTAELSLDDLGLDVDSLEASGSLEDTTSLEKDATAENVAPLRDDEMTQLAPSLGNFDRTMKAPRDKFDIETTGTIYIDQVDLAGGDTVEQPRPENDSTAEMKRPSMPKHLDLDLDQLSGSGSGPETVKQVRGGDGEADNFSSDVFADRTSEVPRVDLDVGDPLSGDDSDATHRRTIAGGDVGLSELEPVTMSEVGTKLDLARAYMDMGDPDGARSILEEVLSEGNASQKQEAQRLMESIR
ncbi:MAG TPA: FimV/HubP family polar landmark protein [Steroidobacteraceae bacterium]|nr:FimV/HubP family polar landmark protein [Steroidobacteraceae bacterium]